MKRPPLLFPLLTAVLLGTAAALPFFTTALHRRDYFFFDVSLTSNAAGSTQLFWDTGRGFNPADSSVQPLKVEPRPVTYRFMMPAGHYRGLRLMAIDREATMTIARARIVDNRGQIRREFARPQIQPGPQIASLTPASDRLQLITTPGATAAELSLEITPPLILKPNLAQLSEKTLPVFLGVFGTVLALSLLPVPQRLSAAAAALWTRLRARPKTTVCLAAFLAVCIQCHPVLFFGRSFVSPNNGGCMLYGTFPTLPGYTSPLLENSNGSDVGAMLFHHVYLPKLQHQALFRDHEWPLWNRHNLTGVPLLGQGQSMFGDPLNSIVILADSAAWAWDLKFVLARWLFAVGLGLTVLALLGRLPLAAGLTFIAVFIGFFGFRLNHAANFSVGYAPWILFAWVRLMQAAAPRARLGAALLLLAANGCVLLSGTIKEAYMLIVCLNFTGGLLILFARETLPAKLHRLLWAAGAGLGCLLLTAPVWLTFLTTLKKSYTPYDQPMVQQLPLWSLPGLFEDLFHRQNRPEEIHVAPSLNAVLLFGFAWALAAFASLRHSRVWLALGLGLLPPLALVFALVPGSVILKIPVLANILHVDNTFSCPLLVIAFVFSAYGLHAFADSLGTRRGWREALGYAVVLGALTAYYFFSLNPPWPLSDFFAGYAASLALGLLFIPLLVRLGSRRIATVALIGGVFLGCWRHSQYVRSPFDDYVTNPAGRVDLQATSPAVQAVNARNAGEPDRPSGFGFNLFPGYNQMIGWESITGVDPVRNRHYEEFARAARLDRIYAAEASLTPDNIAPLWPFLDLLNVRHHLDAAVAAPPAYAGLRLHAALDLSVYTRASAWPRAFFTNRLGQHPQLGHFIEAVRHGDGRPFASIETGDRDAAGAATLSADQTRRTLRNATNYRFTTNTTSFDIEAPSGGVVVLTEAYYPGDFTAFLDGEPVPYFRVNHAFKGIYVPAPGHHHISYHYRPEYFTVSLWLAAAGLAFIVTASVLTLRRTTRV